VAQRRQTRVLIAIAVVFAIIVAASALLR
jgi:hypothetical protein